MKTIKQIADELGVSKQAVRNQIANLGLQSSLRKNGNQFAIDERQETLILQSFSQKTQSENAKQAQTESQSTLQFALRVLEQEVEFLRGQLKEKDEQLKAKDEQISFLQNSFSAQQALHAGTIQQQLTDGRADPADPDATPGFFSRIFRRQKKNNDDYIQF